MGANDIERWFQIDLESDETLVSQLERRLSEFIEISAPGTRIPPERELASRLGISRVTVRNALNKFFEKGEITKNGRRGTFVSEKKSDGIPNDIHPMALGVHLPPSIPAMKLLLFENIPFQKAFWEKATTLFNEEFGVKIKIDWLPSDVQASDMKDYLSRNKVDIVQVDIRQDIRDSVIQFPREFQDELVSGKYRVDLYKGDTRTLLEYVAPIHQTLPFTFWNADLADQIGLRNIPERLRNGEIFDLFEDGAKKLPKDIHACGHAWDIPALRGVPLGTTEDNLEEYVKKEFANFAKSSSPSNMYMTTQNGPLDMVRTFKRGKMLFCCTTPPNMFILGEPDSFELGIEPFHIPAENISCGSAIGLCVSKKCIDTASALDFVKFTLSNEIQGLMATMKRVAPFRKSALKHLEKDIECPTQILEEDIARMSVELKPGALSCRYFNMMTYHGREEIRDLLRSARCPIECAASFMRKWR